MEGPMEYRPLSHLSNSHFADSKVPRGPRAGECRDPGQTADGPGERRGEERRTDNGQNWQEQHETVTINRGNEK